jgi:nucleolar protein 15
VEQEEVDDDTKALVKALDSGDEEEPENQVSTYKKGQDVGKVPKPKKAKSSGPSSGTPGVMYLARIPHGFYEHELREYFGQFGDITRLRVVRNKKTGASRHRAFIEFADAEVADIAARTMDKYLLFGHILSAKIVPPAQVHPNLFKGANRRFKVVPWNKMAGRQLERPLSESQWQVKISKEEQRRAARAEKLKEMGYEFEAPALKAAEAKPLLENGTEEEPKAIEAPPAAEEAEAKVEEEKQVVEPKASKAKATSTTKEATPQKKGKKGKKTKS